MSQSLIRQFHRDLENAIVRGGTRNETSIRTAFQTLLHDYAKTHNLSLVPEVSIKTKAGNTIRPDGVVRDDLQLSRGYWESKDEHDSLEEEISKKLAKGYPRDNILFEDSKTVVLIQEGQEVMKVRTQDIEAFSQLLERFFSYEPPEVTKFHKAIAKFAEDMPQLISILHEHIKKAESNGKYVNERAGLIELAKNTINKNFSEEDAHEMLIQHILTDQIFTSIFDNSQYHEENNIAKSLNKVTKTFYEGKLRREIDAFTRTYYGAIKQAASSIADHAEKQKFLKVIYETFYRAYNRKGAEALGIVYTPNEIVSFMVKMTDDLLQRHFNKAMGDEGIHILDPATGTGTFMTEIMNYLTRDELRRKYNTELHCNEIALLPYYIANLNIEATYAQKMGTYEEFKNIILVDTLDNTGFGISGQAESLFAFTEENLSRAKKQNGEKITVVIGNPPYRANQANENDNNKNKKYAEIDRRIKGTYVKKSAARKTKTYDMYSRFIRWATDRIQSEGMVAFVVNRSFIDARSFDGFRKTVANEYTHIYIVDLGGDIRGGGKNNVFNIMTGIAVVFFIKEKRQNRKEDSEKLQARIMYVSVAHTNSVEEKLKWLAFTKYNEVEFQRIIPDDKGNWLNQINDGGGQSL